MQVRQKLTEFESTIAFVIGGGLILLMLVFGLAAASGGADVSRLNLFLLLGALLLFVGIAVWLFTSRPWRTHDDWSEPLYTGHEHDDHHAEPHVQHAEASVETLAHASAAESTELAAAANIPPSIAAVLEAAETVTAAPDQPVEQAEPQTVVSEEPQSVYAAVEPPAYAQIPEARALNQVAEPVEQAEPQTVVSEEPQSVYAAVEPPAYAQIPEARALNQVAEPVEQAEPQTAGTEEPQSAYAAVEPPAYAQIPEARTPEQAEPQLAESEASQPVAEQPAQLAVPQPEMAETPATKPDDLTIIEGIGPKISAALIAAGVNTFAKLAALQPDEIEKIVRGAGVRMVGRAETWAKQAALAAEGKFDELKAYQKTLTAGRSASDE